MAQTKQGVFDMTYHHIEVPTVENELWRTTHKGNRLLVPRKGQDEAYRSPLLAYLAESHWVFSRKVDGENIRIQWNGEQALWNGKSNVFQCGAEFTEYMNNTFLEEIFEEKFGRDKVVTLFGEKMGPKTQGNELGLKEDKILLYDVNIDGFWLCGESVSEIAGYFGVDTVFDYMERHSFGPAMNLREMIEACANGEFKDWEGIVATPLVEMRDQKGDRVIVKIKNKDYLREGGK